MRLHIAFLLLFHCAAAPPQAGAHLEGEHRQDEGVAGVVGEGIAAVQPALAQHANQPRPRLQSRLQLVLPLALLAALHLNLGRQGNTHRFGDAALQSRTPKLQSGGAVECRSIV